MAVKTCAGAPYAWPYNNWKGNITLSTASGLSLLQSIYLLQFSAHKNGIHWKVYLHTIYMNQYTCEMLMCPSLFYNVMHLHLYCFLSLASVGTDWVSLANCPWLQQLVYNNSGSGPITVKRQYYLLEDNSNSRARLISRKKYRGAANKNSKYQKRPFSHLLQMRTIYLP